jgi:hypothetical protein
MNYIYTVVEHMLTQAIAPKLLINHEPLLTFVHYTMLIKKKKQESIFN